MGPQRSDGWQVRPFAGQHPRSSCLDCQRDAFAPDQRGTSPDTLPPSVVDSILARFMRMRVAANKVPLYEDAIQLSTHVFAKSWLNCVRFGSVHCWKRCG